MKNYLIIIIFNLLLSFIFEIRHYLKKERISCLHRFLFLCFTIYLTILFATFTNPISQWSLSNYSVYLAPFYTLRMEKFFYVLRDVIWFIPLGFMQVLLFKECKKFYVTFFSGLGISILIELLNMFSGIGTNIDNVFINTLGIVIGFLLGSILLRIKPSLQKKIGIIRKSDNKYHYKTKDAGKGRFATISALVFCLFINSINTTELFSFRDKILDSSITIDIQAENACVFNLESNDIIFKKNSYKHIAPASTTKMLTALTALDYCSTEDVVTVGHEIDLISPDSSKAWLSYDDKLTMKQLLVAMLLPSGNDAAYAVAVHVGKNITSNDNVTTQEAISNFVDAMNRKAKSIGAVSSHFSCPDGYDMEGQYTTAYDLAMIAQSCLKNSTIVKIISDYKISETWADGKEVTYNNTNELINPDSSYYYPNAIGIKTGYSNNAGHCLVSAAEIKGRKYLCVIMGDSTKGRWEDSLNIFYEIEKIAS